MNITKSNKIILFLVALEEEAKVFLKKKLYKPITVKNHKLFRLDNSFVGITGVGKICSATSFSAFADYVKPDYVINIGLGGSVSQNLNIGDVCIIDKCFQYDVDVTKFGYKKGQIPSFPEFFLTNNELTQVIATILKSKLNLKKNINCGTSDFFAPPISVHNNGLDYEVIDMELGAILQAEKFTKQKIASVKIISDTTDDQLIESKQIEKSIDKLQKIISDVIEEIDYRLRMSFN